MSKMFHLFTTADLSQGDSGGRPCGCLLSLLGLLPLSDHFNEQRDLCELDVNISGINLCQM